MSILRRNKNFFLLWQGQLVSQIGSKIYLIALSWYFVAELKNNQGFVIALFVSSIPFLLFGFSAGPLVEKWNKKWIIFGSDYISSAISFVLAGLIYWEVQNPIYIYIAVFFLNISLVFFNPAVSSIIPSIVKKEDQQEAISLNTTVQFGAQFIGAALGGVLVGYIGVFYAILFDAISFFLSAVTEMFIKYTPQKIEKTEDDTEEPNTKSIYRYILERPVIAKTFFLFSLVNIFLIPMTVYLPILIENYMGLGSKEFGFAESGLPIGAIIASAYFVKKVTTKNVKFILYSVLFISIPFFLIFFGRSVYIIVAGMIIFGFFLNTTNISAISMYTRDVSPEYHGRFFTILNTVAYGSFPLAYLIAMILIHHFNLYDIILVNGILIATSALLAFKFIKSEPEVV